MAEHIHKVAIVGAGGNLGGLIIRNLLASTDPKFHITAITRTGSTSIPSDITTNSSVTIVSGNYNDHGFLVNALKDHEAFHWSLAFTAPPALHESFVKAAAEAQVPYLIPTEFGSDTDNPKFHALIPALKEKKNIRDLIQTLGVSSWIGIITNPWFDYAYQANMWGIDPKNRTAVLFDSGTTKANTTMLPTAALAVSRVLSLPKVAAEGQPSLEAYRNKMLHIRSFQVSQRDILEATQNVVGDDGWKITEKNTQSYIQEGLDQVAQGDFFGTLKILSGATFTEGFGNVFKDSLANQELDLPEEDFVATTKKVVEGILQT